MEGGKDLDKDLLEVHVSVP